jgi:hypothetical protein
MAALSAPLMLQRLRRLWPLMIVSLGIALSFAWATVLIWFVVCALGSFT